MNHSTDLKAGDGKEKQPVPRYRGLDYLLEVTDARRRVVNGAIDFLTVNPSLTPPVADGTEAKRHQLDIAAAAFAGAAYAPTDNADALAIDKPTKTAVAPEYFTSHLAKKTPEQAPTQLKPTTVTSLGSSGVNAAHETAPEMAADMQAEARRLIESAYNGVQK